jgi:shikimate dehydrogenase
MGVKAEDYAQSLAAITRFTNLRGALVTMPHKVVTVDLVDEVTPAVRIAGACNAVLKRPDGTLLGDQFDGAGFVRGVLNKGRTLKGARVLVSGAGGVGSAIAASLAAAGVGELALYDTRAESAEGLAQRLREHYPALTVRTGSNDPDGFEVVVNATPMGMKEDDPLPFDIARIAPGCFVGEVVMKSRDKGCEVQVGTDMLFEMIPAYLEFFGFGSATAEELRRTAAIAY